MAAAKRQAAKKKPAPAKKKAAKKKAAKKKAAPAKKKAAEKAAKKKAAPSKKKAAPAKKKTAPAKKKAAPVRTASTRLAAAKAPAPRRPHAPSAPLDPATERLVELLRAGALLAHDPATLSRLPADPVSARAYTHPALGDRVVVRLTSDPVAAGEDLVHRFLGFGEPRVVARVAARARRALGFPAWALVNDPKNARHALDVLGEMRQGIRRARSRPGQSKELFDGIARRLGRSVPQFLPSYHEEVARVFAEAGNRSWAGQYFNRAREAERVHALAVDPEERRASFLEFALSGALTTKALAEHAQTLSREQDPASAYASFRELCLRRTLGGVAPWAGMPKELRRLARAAGLDLAREDEALVEELLGAPALASAAADVWSEYRDAVVAVARRSLAARAALLGLAPRPPGKAEGFFDRWLALLDDASALDALAAGEVEVKPATWLSRTVGAIHADWRGGWALPDRLLAIARRLAPRLVADGLPVRVDQGPNDWRHPVDVDLTDLLLEQGVPLAPPHAAARLQLEEWARASSGASDRGRDPVHLARDRRFGRLLAEAVASSLDEAWFEPATRGKQAFVAATRAWVERRLDALQREGLVGARRALDDLRRAPAALLAPHPDLLARLRAVDLTGALARTLRAGVLDELGWPALEAAVAELDPAGDAQLTVGGAFPYLVVASERRALVLGPTGRVLEHDLRLPKRATVELLRYAGGQLLVVYRDRLYKQGAYWSGAPTKTFAPERMGWGEEVALGVELPDGGITEGGRALQVGDTTRAPRRHVLSDGTTFWRAEGEPPATRLRELDPRTGDVGRASWPRFLEEFVAPGWVLDVRQDALAGGCSLVPCPAGLERSPLGARDGLLGLRARRPDRAAAGWRERDPEVESIDGRRFAGLLLVRLVDDEDTDDPDDEAPGFAPAGLLRLPHDERPRPVAHAGLVWAPEGFVASTFDAGDRAPTFARGTPLIAPVVFWHHLLVRDDAGSRALREVTEDHARALLAAAAEALASTSSDPDDGAADDDDDAARAQGAVERAVRAGLPGVTHERLVAGVAGVALDAAALTRALGDLVAAHDPEASAGALSAGIGLEDDAIQDALTMFVPTQGYAAHPDLGREVERVAALLTRDEPLERAHPVGRSGIDWPELIGDLSAVAFKAVAAGTTPEHRAALLRLLTLWAATPFARRPDEFRTATFAFQGKFPYRPARRRGQDDDDSISDYSYVVEVEGARTALRPAHVYDHDDRPHVKALQRARDGRFGVPAGVTVSRERRCEPGWGAPEQLRRFVAEAEARGPLPWDPAIVDELARRARMTRPEAALVWAGLPMLFHYETDFLGKALRERLGLKVKEAGTTRDALRKLEHEQRRRLYAGVLGDDPAALWTPLGSGPDDDDSPVARLARAWRRVVGERADVAPELAAAAARDLKGWGATAGSAIVELFAAPANQAPLTRDIACVVRDAAVIRPDDDVGLDAEVLRAVAIGVPYLYLTRPVGDPVRANLPEVLRLVGERLASPGLLLQAGEVSLFGDDDDDDGDDDGAARRRAQTILDAVGGQTLEAPPPGKSDDAGDDDDDDDGPRRTGRDAGLVVAIADGYSVELWLRTARLRGLEALGALRRLGPAGAFEALESLELVRSDAYATMAARVARPALREGEWEADPRRSAPEVVAQVAERLGLGEDAATLYLQTLALPAPATKLVQTMNGWTAGQYKKAGAELLARKLVVEAKRERAGRALFLPGGWEALRAPMTPVETWKLPLLGASRSADGALSHPFVNRAPLLPLRPIHEVFAAAWKRLEGGDAPRYEEVTRRR